MRPVCIVEPSCGSCPVCELRVTRAAGNKIQDNVNSKMKRYMNARYIGGELHEDNIIVQGNGRF